MSGPWHALLRELGDVHALEIGCGSGVYGRLLATLLGNSLVRYTGIDIEPDTHWQEYSTDPRFAFAVERASGVATYLDGSNLVLTQSALEHFDEDLLYFVRMSEYVRRSEHPVLQIHLVPSAACITTFPWHGVREYTPRTLSKITRLFGAETQPYLFELGGSQCNRVHRQFISWPNLRIGADMRHSHGAAYQSALRTAILNDFEGIAMGSPAFYALVLASNFKEKLLAEQLP